MNNSGKKLVRTFAKYAPTDLDVFFVYVSLVVLDECNSIIFISRYGLETHYFLSVRMRVSLKTVVDFHYQYFFP